MNQPSRGPDPVTSSNNPLNYDQQQHNHTIAPIAPSSDSTPMPPPSKLPCFDLLQGSRENYIKVGVPLYEAAIKGDWKAAKAILDKQPRLIYYAITKKYETVLHVAASADVTKSVEEFVTNLVDMMDEKDLELQNKGEDTALGLAAAAGNVKTASIMLKKNPALVDIPGNNGMKPLYMAALFAKADMVRYLYDLSNKMTGEFWSHENRCLVLQKCVETDIFDVSQKIVNDRPELMVKKGLLTHVLRALAPKTRAFEGLKPHIVFRILNSIFGVFNIKVGPDEKESDAMRLLRIIWRKIAIMPQREIDDIIRGPPIMDGNTITGYHSHVLFIATRRGNTRFIVELIRLYPDLIWEQDDKGGTIFHLAIKRRQINIYKLLYEIGGEIK